MDAIWRKPRVSLRLVCFALPAAVGYVHLITTVDRKVASAEILAEIYRLRWQIELLFRELKSHAGLVRWNTRSQSLTRAMIWLSVATLTLKRFISHQSSAAGMAASTLTCAKVLATDLPSFLARVSQGRTLLAPFKKLLAFLQKHASRAHPARDRRIGRYAQFLEPVS